MKQFQYIVMIVCLCTVSFVQAQSYPAGDDSSFVQIRSYKGDIADAALDNLDNLYVLSSKGQVKKFGPKGDSLAVFNGMRNFGQLFSLDVTNPLKVLLFFKDFPRVVVLDRMLSVVTTLDLKRYNILQPSAIGLSYDNNIWVFDEYDNKLKKINEQGKLMMETADLRNVFNEALSPQKIINDNGMVFLADSAKGVFVFDNYGSFRKKIPLTSWQSIAVNRNQVIGSTPGQVIVFNTLNLMQKEKKLPPFKPYLHSFTSVNRFVTFTPEELTIYAVDNW